MQHSVNPTGPSGRGRGLAIGRGNAGRLSGVKPSSNITRELTGATELQWRIRSCLFTFCLFVFLVVFSLCFRYPVSRLQRSRQNFRSPTTDQIPSDSDNIIGAVLSLGGGLGVTITRSMFGVGEGESRVLIEGGVLNRVWLYIYIFFLFFFLG